MDLERTGERVWVDVGVEEEGCWVLIEEVEDRGVVTDVGEGEELVIGGDAVEERAEVDMVDAGLGETPGEINRPPTTRLFVIASPTNDFG